MAFKWTVRFQNFAITKSSKQLRSKLLSSTNMSTNIGIDVSTPVFSHDMLHVAMSHVGSNDRLRAYSPCHVSVPMTDCEPTHQLLPRETSTRKCCEEVVYIVYSCLFSMRSSGFTNLHYCVSLSSLHCRLFE